MYKLIFHEALTDNEMAIPPLPLHLEGSIFSMHQSNAKYVLLSLKKNGVGYHSCRQGQAIQGQILQNVADTEL